MIDHCMSAFAEYSKDLAFRIYITDGLKVISENTAHFAGGSSLQLRWFDLINPEPEEEKEEVQDLRSCDDIVNSIWRKIDMR